MTLAVRPDLQSLIASLIPSGWQLELLHWRTDDQWEAHLVSGETVRFGYGLLIEDALAQASEGLGGSFNRARRPLDHKPALGDADLAAILADLRPKVKYTIGRRI